MHSVLAAIGFAIPQVGKYDSVRTAPFHPAIHNLGNTGYLGQAHAQGAWFATWLIDQLAYKRINIRREFAQLLAQKYENGTKLVEIGCGVGTLTRELERTHTFDIVGVDTSREMLANAKRHVRCPLLCFNGVDYKETVDVSVICMVMHEMPPCGHRQMLSNLLDISTDVWLVDIDPDYEPSLTMLSGEPYVPDYLATIEETVDSIAQEKARKIHTYNFIPGHVRVWTLRS